MIRTARFALAPLVAVLLLGTACVSPIFSDEFDVATKLQPGQSEELVLVLLREDAEIQVRETLTRPVAGDWGEVIANDRILGVLLVGEVRTGRRVHKLVKVERFWGFRGWEIYHLFFDEQDKLVSFHRRIL